VLFASIVHAEFGTCVSPKLFTAWWRIVLRMGSGFPAQHSLNFSDQKTGTKSAQMVIIAIVKVLLIMNQTPPGAVVAKTDKFSVI
jgi:hypothetical protein